jgi:hypothetical protein
VPSPETVELMKRYDLLYRNAPALGGFSVYGQVKGQNMGGDDLLRFRVKKGDKLVFFLVADQPSLVNFSNLPVSLPPGHIYYFTNEIDDAGASRDDLHLSINDTGVEEADTIRRSGNSYTFRHSAVVAPGAARVRQRLTTKAAEPYQIITEAGKSELGFNLRTLPGGRCDLFINDLPEDSFYYMGEGLAPTVFGVIELVLDAEVKENYRIVESDFSLASQRPSYRIRFANRSTRWRYTIKLMPNSPLFQEIEALPEPDRTNFINDVTISTNTPAAFTKDAYANGQFVFVSNAALPLMERYLAANGKPMQITLKKNSSGVAKIVKDYLPYPSVQVISDEPPHVYSDIFLTI